MGLDQNWLVEDENGEKEEFAYHRKFNALEGYMADIWNDLYSKPGEYKQFNCELLEVTPAILQDLEDTARNEGLEPTSGFFFGTAEKDEWYLQDMRELLEEVIPKAKEYLEQGRTIYYTSWW
jgi:hypothetical protein